jgi:hypothetical protein
MTRPGGRSNAWIRDEETGDVVLRDGSGTEHARFDDADAVFTDRDPHPADGETTVKKPIVPDVLLDDGADSHAEIVTVPEAPDGPEALAVLAGTDMTVPATAIGEREGEGEQAGDDLDVPARAARFFDVLQAEADGGVTSADAEALAAAADDDLDVSRRTIRSWLGDLADEGVLRKVSGDHAADPDEYYLR